MVKGKHIKKNNRYKLHIFILIIVIMVGGIWYLTKPNKNKEDKIEYESLTGQIASVGDETVLIRLKDNTKYLVSIAAVKGSGDELLLGNQITIQYTGQLDSSYTDIQNIKVTRYQISSSQIINKSKTSKEKTSPNKTLSHYVQNMSLEEKIAQMFIVCTPSENQVEFIEQFQPGGYILFGNDFKNETTSSMIRKINSYQDASQIKMFIGTDEEGGTVVRASQYLRNKSFKSPQALYREGGLDLIEQDTETKSQFLSELGINLNFAPVCDVSTDTSDFIYPRAFGKNAAETSTYVTTVVKKMNQSQTGAVLKHFPGYGNNGDTHSNIIHDTRNYDTFQNSDFLPFQAGIEEGADMILVNHNIVDCIDSQSPASLSLKIHQILRKDLHYNGIIITDDLSMEGVRKYGNDEDNAVQAIQAGNDMIITSHVPSQYQAILKAVRNNEISENQIDLSVLRILAYKQQLQIIQ